MFVLGSIRKKGKAAGFTAIPTFDSATGRWKVKRFRSAGGTCNMLLSFFRAFEKTGRDLRGREHGIVPKINYALCSQVRLGFVGVILGRDAWRLCSLGALVRVCVVYVCVCFPLHNGFSTPYVPFLALE